MNKMNTKDVREDQNNGSVNKQIYSIDHKNIELLRYYISRDMQRIQEKVDNDNNNLLGYFVASLVDVLIVSLFQDGLKQLNILCKSLLICVFVFLFYVTYKVVNCIRRRRKQKRKQLEEIQISHKKLYESLMNLTILQWMGYCFAYITGISVKKNLTRS